MGKGKRRDKSIVNSRDNKRARELCVSVPLLLQICTGGGVEGGGRGGVERSAMRNTNRTPRSRCQGGKRWKWNPWWENTLTLSEEAREAREAAKKRQRRGVWVVGWPGILGNETISRLGKKGREGDPVDLTQSGAAKAGR